MQISFTEPKNIRNSFAKLKEGILTVTMPIDKKDTKHKISFK